MLMGELDYKKEWNNWKWDIPDEYNIGYDVLELLSEKPEELELILTGRYASPEIVRNADLVSEILEIKHPYQNGIQSRKGIDW